MAAPLRVLSMNSLAPPAGGAEAHFADLADLLRESGAEVETFVPPAPSAIGALRDRVYSPAVRRTVRDRIRTFRPDVVHVHNFLRRLSVAPFLAARDEGVPTLLTVHDFQLFCPRTWAVRADGAPCDEPQFLRCAFGACRGGLRGLGGRAVYAMNAVRQRGAAAVVRRRATRIVAPCRSLADRLSRTLGRDVGVLPLRPAPAACAEYVAPSSDDLLFVGRIAPEKGLSTLLAALPAGQRLTVAGDGPLLEESRADAARRGLSGTVRFLGRVPRDEVAALQRTHAALVVPSLVPETGPLVAMEAFAAGRPVIGSRLGGVAELVADGATGFLFDPRDVASVRAALERFRAASAADREAMGRRALAAAASAADRRAAFALYESEYRAAMAEFGR